MPDVREQILVRLLAVVTGLPGMRATYRNNLDVAEDETPAVILLDGNEESQDASNPDLSARAATIPRSVQMTPEIVIVEASAGQVGPELSEIRRELIKRVLADEQLNEIVNTYRRGNGAIRYLGCTTGFGWLRDMHGALLLQFLFKYFLKPDDL